MKWAKYTRLHCTKQKAMIGFHIIFRAWMVAVLVLWPLQGYANPEGGTVTAGTATIAADGKTLNINQSTNKAVIDWRAFNIGTDETTAFHQPSASAVTLNRVGANGGPSQIMGALQANGNIMIVNPNGVVFGKDARVDVNGLIATTANISNENFMNGKMKFDQPGNPNAAIVNEGRITAKEAGLIGLVAPNVINNGVITAKLGRAHLASGDTFTADLYGDGLMEVAVSDDVKSQLVKNTGVINAAGGTIALTAAAGGNMVNSLIVANGEMKAPSVDVKEGRIVIAAEGSNATAGNIAADKGQKSGASTVVVAGQLDASGQAVNEKGGSISVTGDAITIKNTANLNASGANGGGQIKIGGDFHGKGTTATALSTKVEKGAVIRADALSKGNGGAVTVWSDRDTEFHGLISARGGAIAGNGGAVEVSGYHNLLYNGLADLTAINGRFGNLLLDPNDITISTSADSSGATSNINTTTLQNQLALSNVTISTAAGSGGNGDIRVNNSISWASTNSLTLTADRDILISDAITNSGSGAVTLQATRNIHTQADITTTGGAVTLNSSSGGGQGNIIVEGNIISGGGNIIMGGGSDPATGYALGNATSGLSGGVSVWNSTVNAGGGNISMHGHGGNYIYAGQANNFGIFINPSATVKTSGTGTITMDGIGGVGGTGSSVNHGILLSGTVSTSGSGAINLTGVGSGDGNGGNYTVGNHGIAIFGTVTSSGSSPITLTGTGTGDGNYGIYSNGTVGGSSYTGNINLISDLFGGYSGYIGSLGAINVKQKTSGKTFLLGTATGDANDSFLYTIITPGTLTFGDANTAAMTINTAAPLLKGSATNFISSDTITLAGNLSKTTGNNTTLSLLAGTNIITNAGKTISSSNNKLNVVMASRYTGGASGYINLNGNITTNGGNITLGGTNNPATGYAIGDATNTGNINSGIYLNGITLNAGGGNVTAHGQGGTYASDNYGIALASSTITTNSIGAVNLDGVGGTGSGGLNQGVSLYSSTVGSTGSGAITVTGTAGSNSNSYGIKTFNATNTFGGASYSGALSLISDNFSLASSSVIRTSGALKLRQKTNGTSIGVGTGSGSLIFTDTDLGYLTYGTLAIGDANTGNINVSGPYSFLGSGTSASLNSGGNITATVSGAKDLSKLAMNATGNVSVTGNGSLTLGNITAGTIFAQASGSSSNMIIGSGKTLTASGTNDAITLVAGGNFTNNSNAGVLSAPNGRWLVYSTNPALNTTNGLSPDFTLSGCTYGGSCTIPTSGNGFIYSSKFLTVTPIATSIVYGDAVPAFTYTLSGYNSGDAGNDTITGNLSAGGYSLGSNAGSYSINGGNLVSSLGYTFIYNTLANGLTVAKKAITAAFSATLSKIYGNANPTLTSSNFNFTGLVGSDSKTLFTSITPNFGSIGANSNVSVGNAVSATIGATTNYTISNTPSTTMDITPRPLTVTTNAQSKTYGATNPTFTGSNSGLTSYDVSQGVSFIYAPVSYTGDAGTYVIGATAADANSRLSNYTRTNTYSNFTVNKKALTATVVGQNVTYGTSVPTSTITYTGFAGSDTAAVIDTAPTIASAQNGIVNAGTYTGNYTASGAVDNNYSFNYVAGNLVVNKKAVTASFASPLSKVYGDANPTLNDSNFTFTGLVGSDSRNLFTSITPNFGAVNANSNVSSGNAVSATIGATANYTVSNTPSTTLAITPRTLTIATDAKSKTVSASDPAFTSSITGLTAYDAGLVSWTYQPIAYSGAIGSYTIGAMATDPSNRLTNYARTDSYGHFDVLADAPKTITPIAVAMPPMPFFELPPTFIFNSQILMIGTGQLELKFNNMTNYTDEGRANAKTGSSVVFPGKNDKNIDVVNNLIQASAPINLTVPWVEEQVY